MNYRYKKMRMQKSTQRMRLDVNFWNGDDKAIANMITSTLMDAAALWMKHPSGRLPDETCICGRTSVRPKDNLQLNQGEK